MNKENIMNKIRNNFTYGLCEGSRMSCISDCYLSQIEDNLFNIYCDDVIVGEVKVDCDTVKSIVYFKGTLHLFANDVIEWTRDFITKKLGDL